MPRSENALPFVRIVMQANSPLLLPKDLAETPDDLYIRDKQNTRCENPEVYFIPRKS